MSRKSTLMRKEQEIIAAQQQAAAAVQVAPISNKSAHVLVSSHQDEAGDSSDDEDLRKSHKEDDELDEDGKPRISWDRNVRGDKNGLKAILMNCVYENRFHVDGKMKENFRKVSQILSAEGGKFDRFNGIAASGAQRKYNNLLRDVAKTFKISENGADNVDETDAEGFEITTLKVLRDLIEREKAKKVSRVKRVQPEEGATEEPNLDESQDEIGFINKKRKSDVLALRNAVKTAAGVIEPAAAPATSSSTTEELPAEAAQPVDASSVEENNTDPNASRTHLKIHRLDKVTHDKVLETLKSKAISTVGDLFKAAGISQAGCNLFTTVSGIRLDRNVDRFLKLYEEVAADNEFVSKMKELTGMTPGDILEVEAVVRPLY